MSTSDDLPLLPEIWLQMLGHLPHSDLKNASLVCQSLRQMGQPLLFHSLSFRPYIIDLDGQKRCLPSEDVVQRTLQKLIFCSSNQLIAPGVRKVDIFPIPESFPGDERQDYNLILDNIFNHLPKFMNLMNVVCHTIWCTSQHLTDLSKLGRLEKLFLTDCHLEIPADRSATLGVSFLSITSRTPCPSDEWFSYFRPDTISIIFGFLYASYVPDLVISLTTIQHLESLATTIDRDTLPLLEAVFSHHPPLRVLRLHTSGMTRHDICALSFTPLPLLHAFQGPYELLQAVSTTESLHNLLYLELSSVLAHSNDEPDDVKLALMSLGKSATQLEQLKFSVKYLTEDLLNTAVNLCSSLAWLSISTLPSVRAIGPAGADTFTLEELAGVLERLNLPQHIEELSLDLGLGTVNIRRPTTESGGVDY